jgi:hypothetical protein
VIVLIVSSGLLLSLGILSLYGRIVLDREINRTANLELRAKLLQIQSSSLAAALADEMRLHPSGPHTKDFIPTIQQDSSLQSRGTAAPIHFSIPDGFVDLGYLVAGVGTMALMSAVKGWQDGRRGRSEKRQTYDWPVVDVQNPASMP